MIIKERDIQYLHRHFIFDDDIHFDHIEAQHDVIRHIFGMNNVVFFIADENEKYHGVENFNFVRNLILFIENEFAIDRNLFDGTGTEKMLNSIVSDLILFRDLPAYFQNKILENPILVKRLERNEITLFERTRL